MEGGKRSIFAVNTVALVMQQADYIRRHTGLRCKGYSGDMQVDYWKEEQWQAEVEACQVINFLVFILPTLLWNYK